VVRARMTLRPVDSIPARVALHQSARSRGYKLSREGADPRSLRGYFYCYLSEVSPLIDMVPTSLFIVSKGRAQVTFAVKR
jgi:hypothetical protein